MAVLHRQHLYTLITATGPSGDTNPPRIVILGERPDDPDLIPKLPDIYADLLSRAMRACDVSIPDFTVCSEDTGFAL